jgi:hypothetical protein
MYVVCLKCSVNVTRKQTKQKIQIQNCLYIISKPPTILFMTAVLLSIPKEAFVDSFQKLSERCQPCVVKDDDCFEGQ